ncbi:MAG: hypothetical protein J6P93_02190 [Alphaproteobacteria bacterium]|nr:hypothetical protein [Alphaproteobacteria bacterium]
MALKSTIEKCSLQASDFPKLEKFLAFGGIRFGNRFPCVWEKAKNFRKMPTSLKATGLVAKRGARD